MTAPTTAVAHLITADAPLLGEPRVDVLPEGVDLGEQEPLWSSRVPPQYERDVDAYLRGLAALSWPPLNEPVEVQFGHATVAVQVPDHMLAPLSQRPAPAARTPIADVVEGLADDLGLEPDTIWVHVDALGISRDSEVAAEVAGDIRDVYDHYCERTAPAFWYPGSDPDAGSDATKMR